MTLDRLTTAQLRTLHQRTYQRASAARQRLFFDRPLVPASDAALSRYWLRCDMAERIAGIYRQRLVDDLS